MPLYRYTAISMQGKKYRSVIDAQTMDLAKQKLVQQKILLLSIRREAKKTLLSEQEVYFFMDSLARLLKAGLPIFEALTILEEKHRKHKMGAVILDVRDQVLEGKTLSLALQRHAESFGILYCSMVANAENSGTLEQTLEEIAGMIARRQKMKKKVVSSSLYPAILLLFSFVVVFFILFFVLPSLYDIFEGRSLSPFTSAVLSTSRFLYGKKEYVFLVLMVIFGGVTFFVFFPKTRNLLVRTLHRFPVVGPLRQKMALVRFSRTLAILLERGVAYEKALELSAEVMNHPPLFAILSQGRKYVIDGRKLSNALKESSSIPYFFTQMIALAEESGNFAHILHNVAEVYEGEVEKMLTRIPTILQPLLLIILGIIVGIVVLSVLLPLTDVQSFLKVGSL
ncbi:MAG: type II secretion system F family protein [Parachlamydiales bacterium]|nr:type II secretion system F family protein [Parachlamydiales bacterium]